MSEIEELARIIGDEMDEFPDMPSFEAAARAVLAAGYAKRETVVAECQKRIGSLIYEPHSEPDEVTGESHPEDTYEDTVFREGFDTAKEVAQIALRQLSHPTP